MARRHLRRMSPRAIISKLIELGADPDIDRPDVLSKYPDLHHVAKQVRCRWGPRTDFALPPYSLKNLECLLKGIVIAELRLNWGFGSTTPVHYILHEIGHQSSRDASRLRQWVMRHSTNGWAGGRIPEHMVPYLDEVSAEVRERWFIGFQKRREEEGRRQYRKRRARLIRIERQEERNRQARANRKAQKRARDAERRRARDLLLDRAADLDDVGRLRLVIEHQDTPLGAFPREWARIPTDFLARMTKADIDALLARTRDRRKGVWRNLCRQIVEQVEQRAENRDQPTPPPTGQ